MTLELFVSWCKYFVKTMEGAGYGRKHGKNVILLIDGHSSRWTFEGLTLLIKHGFYPFCIGSHTSAWHQPNDVGPNAKFKATLGKVIHEWRVLHPFSVFDRTAFNHCLARTIAKMKMSLAAELAAWEARKRAWLKTARHEDDRPCPALVDVDADDLYSSCPPLVGKPGNVITRAWERTGWWPLKKDSENWNKVINSVGQRFQKQDLKAEDFAKLGKGLKIRQLAWEGYNDNFLEMARELKQSVDQQKRRKRTSVVDTRKGRGFTCADDIEFLREREEEKQAELKVYTHTHITITPSHITHPQP